MPTLKNSRYLLHESPVKGGKGIVYHVTDQLSGDLMANKRVPIRGSQLQFGSLFNAESKGMVNLLIQVLQALDYQNQRNMLHHDIKSANMLVKDSGLRVIDFGLIENPAISS